MHSLSAEASRFKSQKSERDLISRQAAAFLLISGIDLHAALDASAAERQSAAAKVRCLLERERMKGIRGHWSYDLSRHMALKGGLDRLLGVEEGRNAKAAPEGAAASLIDAAPVTGVCRASGPSPSSLQAAIGRRHSSARPSDSSRQDPTSRDILPASNCNASSDAASAT